ncbi:MAG: MerR family transcriptional regulator [Pseudomonadota bacterium]
MNIGQVAAASGLPAKTIRYYEEIGLVTPQRSLNGYRRFRNEDVHVLAFLARARAVGFSIDDCRALLAIYDPLLTSDAEALSAARDQAAEIDRKMQALGSIRDVLAHMARSCRQGRRPLHPMLDDLAGGAQRGLAAE